MSIVYVFAHLFFLDIDYRYYDGLERGAPPHHMATQELKKQRSGGEAFARPFAQRPRVDR